MNSKFLTKRLNRFILGFLRKIDVNKRQRFVVSVIIASIALFISEYFLGKSGILIVFGISALSSFLLLISIYEDMRANFYPQVLILPFFYTLAFGLFYLLVPARFLTRVVMTSLFAIGLYSLYLSINIFAVSSIRTIALLASARTVSFAITLLSYFFLANVVFSLHLNLFFSLFLLLIFTFPIILASLWTYTLEKSLKSNLVWNLSLTAIVLEISTVLWFWPTTPTLIALFITGVFYALVGLTEAWFEKRLFRGVIFEYFWIAIVTFTILIFFTAW